jgi:hypothetical protein
MNNAYISDHGSFHFLPYYLHDIDVGSSSSHIIFIRSRMVTEIKPTVPEQNAATNGRLRTLATSSLEIVWVLILHVRYYSPGTG